jgi:hypothetical protein
MRHKFLINRVAVFLTCFPVMASAAIAASPKPDVKPEKSVPPEKYIRLTRDKDNVPLALETAIVHCTSPQGDKGATVDLIAAVHVAEKSYYDQLNDIFAGYDTVLYELVAKQGTQIPKGGVKQSGNLVSMAQKSIQDMLHLEYQLEKIDYTRKNFVHADLSPEELAKAMNDRGESVWTLLFRMMAYSLTQQNKTAGKSSDLDLLLALLDKDRSLALKRALARQFEDMEGSLAMLEGPNGSALISGRNQAVVSVLKKEMASGKRKIAIFYGAGHMSDLQQRLREGFGLTPASTRWLEAWNMKPKTNTTSLPEPTGESAKK